MAEYGNEPTISYFIGIWLAGNGLRKILIAWAFDQISYDEMMASWLDLPDWKDPLFDDETKFKGMADEIKAEIRLRALGRLAD